MDDRWGIKNFFHPIFLVGYFSCFICFLPVIMNLNITHQWTTDDTSSAFSALHDAALSSASMTYPLLAKMLLGLLTNDLSVSHNLNPKLFSILSVLIPNVIFLNTTDNSSCWRAVSNARLLLVFCGLMMYLNSYMSNVWTPFWLTLMAILFACSQICSTFIVYGLTTLTSTLYILHLVFVLACLVVLVYRFVIWLVMLQRYSIRIEDEAVVTYLSCLLLAAVCCCIHTVIVVMDLNYYAKVDSIVSSTYLTITLVVFSLLTSDIIMRQEIASLQVFQHIFVFHLLILPLYYDIYSSLKY